MAEQTQNETEVDDAVRLGRKRRGAPWLLGGLVLLLLSALVALQAFGLWEMITPDTAADTLLLYALSTLNFVAFLVFAFIFVRNLLKLRRERRARVLGSKLKTRLVVYFIAVSLLPITALAVFSYLFFNRAVDKWFSSLPESVVQQAREVRAGEGRRRAQSFRETVLVAHGSLLDGGPSVDLEGRLDSLAERGNLSLLAIEGPEEFRPVKAARGLRPGEAEAILRDAKSAVDQQNLQGQIAVGGNVYDVMRLPVGGRHALTAARARQTDSHLTDLVNSSQTFEHFKRRQRKVRLLGLSTLGLLTLLIVFAATWAAIHLARGIGTPIKALAEAAGEVARGNLTHRVTALADDELAVLAASFNAMTEQLEESRRRIEAGAAELREKNLALDERRNYIETVLESLSTGVVSLDEQNRVTTINAAALHMLQLADPPRPGTPLAGVIADGDRVVLERVLTRARRAGRAAWQMELTRGASPEGGTLPASLTATALGPNKGGGRGVVLVIEDLTELLAAQRAAAWSEVARRMAHEIKNPLTPIQLSAERIARQFKRAGGGGAEMAGPPLRPSGNGNGAGRAGAAAPERERITSIVEECTATITREVAGLKAMVDEFSRFARLPHAKLEAADLNEVVRQAVALYEERLEGARMDVYLARQVPATMLDPEQMRRVLVNLIDNALEAMSPEDAERRVTVATAYDAARGQLLLEVTDTGHGIARGDFPRLFQPYFSTRGRGTGLGLAIVQRIINDHGGRIRAEANRPRGAKFVVELPVTDETRANDEGGTMNAELEAVRSRS